MLPSEWFGARHVEWHEEIDSTNTRAAALALDIDLPLPALVVADRQTAGRGRGANRWWSADGALMFSLLLDATDAALPTAQWPLVSLALAIAIGDALAAHLPPGEVQLKWPNDVYTDGKKICGILVEAPATRPARLIVGAGVNVNNRLIDAPEEIIARATSLADQCDRELDRETILGEITARFLTLLPQVAANTFDLPALWGPRCLLAGKEVWIASGERTITGRCHGIDASGALLVQTPQGPERLFAGIVRQWR